MKIQTLMTSALVGSMLIAGTPGNAFAAFVAKCTQARNVNGKLEVAPNPFVRMIVMDDFSKATILTGQSGVTGGPKLQTEFDTAHTSVRKGSYTSGTDVVTLYSINARAGDPIDWNSPAYANTCEVPANGRGEFIALGFSDNAVRPGILVPLHDKLYNPNLKDCYPPAEIAPPPIDMICGLLSE